MRVIVPPLKWHGGKQYLANRIAALFPPHLHYVEPFAGGLAILLARNPEDVSEVVNDLDSGLSNFWRVLQDESLFMAFRRRIESTPFSQIEWEVAGTVEPVVIPDLDAAVRFFVRCRMSLAGRRDTFAPLSRRRTRRGMNEQASAWLTAVEGLPLVHERLKRVVVLQDDALRVIRREDGPDTCFYLDPPYLPTTRAAADVYRHEMSVEDHIGMLDLILSVEGKVLLSGYANELYDERLAGWKVHHFDLPNNAAGGATKRRMVESVWCNF